jgi:hypothetical protein
MRAPPRNPKTLRQQIRTNAQGIAVHPARAAAFIGARYLAFGASFIFCGGIAGLFASAVIPAKAGIQSLIKPFVLSLSKDELL